MATCFVIQPFDGGRFDKMFDGVYSPVITAAGLEPYRVDQDPNAEILIDAIESGIRAAAVCLADITTDNPNVWYELGYAFACNRQVVMVCGSDRAGRRFPFDIQHRAIVTYTGEAPQDFDALKATLGQRLHAAVDRANTVEALSDAEQLAPVGGLTQHELVVLAVLASGLAAPDDGKSVYGLQHDATKAGITELAYSLGMRKLLKRRFIEMFEDENFNGETFKAARLTESGWEWMEVNEDKFMLRRGPKLKDFDEEIPF
jgi:hypothetical protein